MSKVARSRPSGMSSVFAGSNVLQSQIRLGVGSFLGVALCGGRPFSALNDVVSGPRLACWKSSRLLEVVLPVGSHLACWDSPRPIMVGLASPDKSDSVDIVIGASENPNSITHQ